MARIAGTFRKEGVKYRRPPRLGTWLLDRLRPNAEAPTGDLEEEYQSGRSRTWYWKQTIGVVIIGSYEDIRSHKLLAVRAIATGWAVLLIFSLILWSLSLDLVGGLLPLRWHVYLWVNPPIVQLFLGALGCIAYASSGWIVAKLHGQHRSAMLLVYVLSLTVWRFPGFGTMIVSHHRPSYAFVLLISSLVLAVNVASILAGGLLGGRPSNGDPSQKYVRVRPGFPDVAVSETREDGKFRLNVYGDFLTCGLGRSSATEA